MIQMNDMTFFIISYTIYIIKHYQYEHIQVDLLNHMKNRG